MPQGLQSDIQQKKPFRSIYEEAELNIVRTASILTDEMAQVLKQSGVSPQQYNVLRILKGSEPTGLCRNDVRDRMLTRMPDMTRLLDRMEEAGLVKRERSDADRRQVNTHITAAGKKILRDLETPVATAQAEQLGHMNDRELKQLIELLTKARSR